MRESYRCSSWRQSFGVPAHHALPSDVAAKELSLSPIGQEMLVMTGLNRARGVWRRQSCRRSFASQELERPLVDRAALVRPIF